MGRYGLHTIARFTITLTCAPNENTKVTSIRPIAIPRQFFTYMKSTASVVLIFSVACLRSPFGINDVSSYSSHAIDWELNLSIMYTPQTVRSSLDQKSRQ